MSNNTHSQLSSGSFQAIYILFFAVMVSSACVISYCSGLYFAQAIQNHLPRISGLWAVISTILVFNSSQSQTFHASIHRIIGSILGALIATVFFTFIGMGLWVWYLACIAIVIVAFVIRMGEDSKLALLTCVLIYVIQQASPNIAIWQNSAERCIESIIGIVIAVIFSLIFGLFSRLTTKFIQPNK